ncbi:hypothetical protein F5144DRAFT_544659 [Chaetomium tenue]|uniref:Uncharacterized protein n=1 Tax=Chaetomium tenue TaxID=1854479 RepID=A0ACB7PHC6_9PEZI|nr:hypothetical protein F5144DRAFT_544659 [Chaetomium globosum]
MPEYGPNTEPLPSPATATIPEEICLHSVSVYGKPGVAAQSLGYLVKPLNHGPGHPHTISVHLLALLLNYSVEDVKQWAAAGDCFVELAWTFPGSHHPEFVTRHRVVTDTAPGHLSFSDGIDWAHDMQKAVRCLQQRPAYPTSGHQMPLPRWNPAVRPPYGGTKPLPLYPPVSPMDIAQPASFSDLAHGKELRSPAALECPVYGLHKPEQDTVSVAPSEPSLAGDTASNSSVVFSEPAEMAAAAEENLHPAEKKKPWHTGSEDGKSSSCGTPPRQQQIERLRRMKKDADALFARNGDPSGLLAVLAEASLSNENWDASGLPRF